MEFNVIINQAALVKWIEAGQVDLADAAIIGFIRCLHPDNPRVKELMLGDMYRLSREWILREVPLLRFTADRLSRRLKNLETVGLVKLHHVVDEKKQFKLYGKLTPLYYRHEEISKMTVGIYTSGAQTGRSRVPAPAVRTPIDPKKEDHKEGGSAPPNGGRPPGVSETVMADAGKGLQGTINALQDRDPEPTETVEEMAARLRRDVFRQGGVHAHNEGNGEAEAEDPGKVHAAAAGAGSLQGTREAARN